jgi:hypothetical protein
LEVAFQRLTTSLGVGQLVSVLKSPFCVDETRTIILQQLGQRKEVTHRFEDLWDMVAWMQQNRPAIDLESPPKLLEPTGR